ncbi:MAG: hypothetical protein QG657_2333 [Acidobacteriota bacterium]|nr:hypothetical protein [Acidobacteriota bacterium]
MFNILKKYQYIITDIEVIRYEIEEDQIRIQIKLELRDSSLLVIRDYKFSDNSRKYVYHWMDKNGNLRIRWDNAGHWKTVSTFPNHKHVLNEEDIRDSTESDIESVLDYIKEHIGDR